MPIVVDCPGCRKRYEVDASLAGKKSRCKLCGEVFRLPVPEGKVIETATQPKPPSSPQRAARESFLDNQALAAGDSRASTKGASNANRGTSAGRPITVNCPGCGKRYEIDAALAGKKSRCKQCGEVFSIPVPMGIVTEPPTKPARATSPPTPDQRPARDLLFDDDEPVAFKRAQSTAAPVDEEEELPPPRRMSYPKPQQQSSARRQSDTQIGITVIGWFLALNALAFVGIWIFCSVASPLPRPAAMVFAGYVIALPFISLPLCAWGGIWLLVISFRESTTQGLLCLLVPCYQFYYVFSRWDDTRVHSACRLAPRFLSLGLPY